MKIEIIETIDSKMIFLTLFCPLKRFILKIVNIPNQIVSKIPRINHIFKMEINILPMKNNANLIIKLLTFFLITNTRFLL